jgi:hypothetical protein
MVAVAVFMMIGRISADGFIVRTPDFRILSLNNKMTHCHTFVTTGHFIFTYSAHQQTQVKIGLTRSRRGVKNKRLLAKPKNIRLLILVFSAISASLRETFFVSSLFSLKQNFTL